MLKVYIIFSENLSVEKFVRRKIWPLENVVVGKFAVGKIVSENFPSENFLSEKPPDTFFEIWLSYFPQPFLDMPRQRTGGGWVTRTWREGSTNRVELVVSPNRKVLRQNPSDVIFFGSDFDDNWFAYVSDDLSSKKINFLQNKLYQNNFRQKFC